jgi:polysaccharide biosynthesis/export protein
MFSYRYDAADSPALTGTVRIASLLVVLVLTGCAGSRGGVTDPAMAGALPPPVVATAGHRIAVDDLLEVTVLEAPELSRAYRVGTNGDIGVPLLGSVAVAGSTPREVEALLRSRLSERYMHDPQVSVELKEVSTHPIYVMGEVNRPGSFPLAGNRTMTVLQAVALGEGLAPLAAGDRAMVIRTTSSGERVKIAVNLPEVVGGRSPDVPLQANDVVFVPKDNTRAFGQGLLGALLRVVTFRAIF